MFTGDRLRSRGVARPIMVGFHPADSGSNPDASTFSKRTTESRYRVIQKAKVLILSDAFLGYILTHVIIFCDTFGLAWAEILK